MVNMMEESFQRTRLLESHVIRKSVMRGSERDRWKSASDIFTEVTRWRSTLRKHGSVVGDIASKLILT